MVGEVAAHARARRQRLGHVAQRLRIERARLGRALQRLVDVAHAPVGPEERQRLADVAQRARLAHFVVARPRRVERVVERQRAREGSAAHRLRALGQLVEEPVPRQIVDGLVGQSFHREIRQLKEGK